MLHTGFPEEWQCFQLMQQDFYNEIANRYSEYVEYLKQIGEYDLGSGGDGSSGRNTIFQNRDCWQRRNKWVWDDSILEQSWLTFSKTILYARVKQPACRITPGERRKELQKEVKLEYEGYMEAQLQRKSRQCRILWRPHAESSSRKKIQKLVEKVMLLKHRRRLKTEPLSFIKRWAIRRKDKAFIQ